MRIVPTPAGNPAEDTAGADEAVEAPYLHSQEQWATFLGGFLHELRTPISSSRMLADLLLESPEVQLGPRERRYCENLNQVLQEIQDLVADAGELARLALGGEPAPPRPAALAEAARKAEEAIHTHAWEAGIAVTSFVDPRLADSFPTDAPRLTRLLLLLLDGGVSHARSEVFLRLDADGDRLGVTVSSDGAPFPEPAPPGIFAPYAADALALRKRRGRGLALPLAHELARSLGGRLGLENVRGRPTFLLSLPRPGAPRSGER